MHTALTEIGTVAAVAVIAALLVKLSRVVFRRVLTRVSNAAVAGRSSRWRARLPRRSEEGSDLIELRRRHRVDATASALARVTSILIWTTALIVVLHRLELDVTVAVSGAGFVGLIIAFGAQNSVHDYVAGLHVLLEDRYGAGDDIEVTTASGQRIRGNVGALGAFATQIESGDTTWHIANRMMVEVANHSQRGMPTTVDIVVPDLEVTAADVSNAVQHALGDLPTQSVMIVQGVEKLPAEATAHDAADAYRVTVRANRTLRADEREQLERHARRSMHEHRPERRT
jgi:small conductance mechanosensitive channel